LNHGGDFAAAAKELRSAGYGEEQHSIYQAEPVLAEVIIEKSDNRGVPQDKDAEKPVGEDGPERDRDVLLACHDFGDLFARWKRGSSDVVIPTTIRRLDERIGGGLPVGQITTIAGYTAVGKTEFARQLRLGAVKAGFGCVHVLGEMNADRIFARDLSQATDLPSVLLRNKEINDSQWDLVETTAEKLRALPIQSLTCPGPIPLDTLGAAILEGRAKLPDGPWLLVLDSLQRLAPGSGQDNPRLQVQEFMRWAATFAGLHDAAVILTSEQKRTSEGRRPSAKDLLTSGAESRAIEFQSDVLIGLIPKAVDDDEEDLAEASEYDPYERFSRKVEVLVGKAREGQAGYVNDLLVFTGPSWGMELENRVPEIKDLILASMDGSDGPVTAGTVAKMIKKRKALVVKAMRAMTTGMILDYVDNGPESRGYIVSLPPPANDDEQNSTSSQSGNQ